MAIGFFTTPYRPTYPMTRPKGGAGPSITYVACSAETSTGASCRVIPSGIWGNDGVFYRFPERLETAPSRIQCSNSGCFIALVIEGGLVLITLANGSCFADALDPDNTSYCDACFTFDELFLIALTTDSELTMFRVMPPQLERRLQFEPRPAAPALSLKLFESDLDRLFFAWVALEAGDPVAVDIPSELRGDADREKVGKKAKRLLGQVGPPCARHGDADEQPPGAKRVPGSMTEAADAVYENADLLERREGALKARRERVVARAEAVVRRAIEDERTHGRIVRATRGLSRRIQSLIDRRDALDDDGRAIRAWQAVERSDVTARALRLPETPLEASDLDVLIERQFLARLERMEYDMAARSEGK